jgi:hypothetical protein
MKANLPWVLLAAVAVFEPVQHAKAWWAHPTDLMPRVEDYTSMWWVEGFPPVGPQASWLRCIQSGTYALVIDTETLEIPHFGAIPPGTGYQSTHLDGVPAWTELKPAKLELTLTVNGKTYRCDQGAKWTRFTGPRLVESGRFVQRADVTDLSFVAAGGEKLNVEARFETVAWPDRLGLILAVRPGLVPGQKTQEPPANTRRHRRGDESVSLLREEWNVATLEISFHSERGVLKNQTHRSSDTTESSQEWSEVSLSLDPVSLSRELAKSWVTVLAKDWSGSATLPVEYEATRGWHRVNLDSINPIAPPGEPSNQNDAIERIRLVLSNPEEDGQIARLLFAKGARGIRQRIGSPITGVSAILRNTDGQPTGIPVQLSKNWHTRPEGGVYAGQWFHGFSQVRLPARATVELELTLAYGHWGGVPAASHAQLSLIGWGSNQHWSQSALGAWGESICFEPDQVQANCTITDVRPVMVGSKENGRRWAWTSNVGGGDFLRFFDTAGDRVPHTGMRTTYHRHGPCLTEVTYAGRIGADMSHSSTVSLARTDDIVRGVYQLRLEVNRPVEFSRFVFFQIGADTYSYTGERKVAFGNESGLVKEWNTQWGGNTYRTEPMECTGFVPWISLHEAVPRENEKNGAWANRGIVIRSWKARLSGRTALPWIAERGLSLHRQGASTLDILPPPGTSQLEAGDFIEATVEHIVMPQYATDYYGPNQALRAALTENENTWRMILREARENDRLVQTVQGTLEQRYPDVRIRAEDNHADFTLTGGLGYVPITFTGLTRPAEHVLLVDGQRLDQSVHGNDFWQTDYEPATRRWSQTYNVPITDGKAHRVHLTAAQ